MTQRTRTLLLSTLLLPAPSLAQEQVTTPTPQTGAATTADAPRNFSISPYASHAFDADLDDDSGSSVSITRVGIDTNTRLPVWQNVNLTLGLLGEYSNYRFSFPAPDSDDSLDVLQIQLAPGLEYELDGGWSLFGGGLLQATGETSADVGNSLNYGGFVGARHKVSDTLAYTFGVAALTQLEDDVRIAPILGLEWNLTEALLLSVGGSANGAQVRLQQALSKTLAIAGVVGYEYRQYRLDDKGAIPDGILQDSRLPVALELAWQPCPSFATRLTAGYVVWSELELNDEDGRELTNVDVDPTPFVGLSANWQF